MNVKIIPQKLNGILEAPPSKSHAHRVLIARKLAQLQHKKQLLPDIPSFSQDIEATKNCLAQLDETLPRLNCRESGSTLRFMLPVAMALKDEAVFSGSGKLPSRPISPLKEEMEAHGCSFHTVSSNIISHENTMGICTIKGRLTPGSYALAGNVSSQFITGLLFALPLLNGDSSLQLTTRLESAGYVDLTLDVLRTFGIKITEKKSQDGLIRYEIPGNQLYTEPESLLIQCDWSNAAFWLACGALGGDITLKGLDLTSSQRDKEFIYILEKMGAKLTISPPSVENDNATSIRCSGSVSSHLQGADISVLQIPDLVPVLAAVMSLAEGSSMITDAQRLRIKESDRLFTVFDFLSRLGADIKESSSGLSITGQSGLTGGQIYGHNDHRIVMAAATASCACSSPVTISGAEAVSKSYPDFFKDFAALGGHVYEV